jgi:hypothetical protein
MTYGASLARVNANTDWTRNQNPHKQEHSNPTAASEPGNGEPGRGSKVVMRFLLIIKGVLLSSVVNALLVFVPVGIAVRKQPSILSLHAS